MENKYYYKIDVIDSKDGYSFMVSSEYLLDNEAVLNRCVDMGYFDDNEDVYHAVIDNLVSEYDIKHFEDCNLILSID